MTLASLNTKDVGDVLSSIREQMSNPDLLSTDAPSDAADKESDVLILTKALEDEGSSFEASPENNKAEEADQMTSTTTLDETVTETTSEDTATESPEEVFKEAQSEVEDIFAPTTGTTNTFETFKTEPSSFATGASVGSGYTENLVSPSTVTESTKAFSELSGMINQIQKQATKAIEVSEPFSVSTAGNYTLDTLMRELLKPMLKDWLDAHLPSLVKWLVAEQIEKMLLANGIATGKGTGATTSAPATATPTATPEEAAAQG